MESSAVSDYNSWSDQPGVYVRHYQLSSAVTKQGAQHSREHPVRWDTSELSSLQDLPASPGWYRNCESIQLRGGVQSPFDLPTEGYSYNSLNETVIKAMSSTPSQES